VAHESCKSIVYGDKAYSISDKQEKLRSLGIRNFRVDFLTKPYTEAAIHDILTQIVRAGQVPHTHPANFDRSLL
jgi:putative protease